MLIINFFVLYLVALVISKEYDSGIELSSKSKDLNDLRMAYDFG
jgi:hypothetical protein